GYARMNGDRSTPSNLNSDQYHVPTSTRNNALGDTHMAQTATRNEPADINIPVNNAGGDFTVVPAGIYQVEFIGFDDGPSFPNRNDPTMLDKTIRLKYTILEGDYAGETIDELASLKGGVKSRMRQRAEALRNEPYAADDSIRLVPLYGKRAQAVVRVEENEKGPRNKIDSLVPPPAPRIAGTAARPAAAAAAVPGGRNF
ncbi:MAG TPA: hypothetical protein VNM48_06700, partial [Chloroflexota bacterium]|nr:hypothetical protein [Chloroflexota bacterium]